MKFRNLPAIITLAGGFVLCIITLMNGYSIETSLLIMAIAMVAFYGIGLLVKMLLDRTVKKEEAEAEAAESKDDAEPVEGAEDDKNIQADSAKK